MNYQSKLLVYLVYLFKIKFYIFLSLFIIILSIISISLGYLFIPGDLGKEKIIIIKQGLSIHEISRFLKNENIVSNAQLFKVASIIYSYIAPLKSGEYKFIQNVAPYQVLDILVKGKSIVHKMCIPERYTVNQILEIVNSEKRLIGKVNSNILEGHLMPATYFYRYGDHRNQIVNIMYQCMSNTLDELTLRLSKNSPIKTRSDVLILASIIEGEASSTQELSKVSAVFINRLKKGMKLQSDSTTIYAITKGLKLFNSTLKSEDMKIRSPHNTYYVYGLPVTAISCPGRKSIEAAVLPAKIDDLYFVADGKGGHYFSKTFTEHRVKIKKIKSISNKITFNK